MNTKASFTLDNRFVVATVVGAFLACFLLTGCTNTSRRGANPVARSSEATSTPDLTLTLGTPADRKAEQLRRLREQFDVASPECVAEYCETARESLDQFERNLADVQPGLVAELRKQVLELDGFLARGKQLRGKTPALKDQFIELCRKHLAPSFEAYASALVDNHELIQDRLLVDLDPPVVFLVDDFLVRFSFVELESALKSKSSHALKTLDEGVSWIPLVGDGIDIVKIFWDPRERHLLALTDRVASKLATAAESDVFANARRGLLTEDDVIRQARRRFSPAEAARRLRAQREQLGIQLP